MSDVTQVTIDILQRYGWKIFWILVIFFLGRWSIKFTVQKIKRLNEERIKKHLARNIVRRTKTIENVVNLTANIVLYSIILLMVLDLFNVKIGPLLTGAGIVGLALGLGAQRLLQNFFAGFFILVDDQFDIGDKVKINDIEGEVVKMSIHSTVIKGKDGRLVYLPNGSINEVTNFSQGTIMTKDSSGKPKITPKASN